LIGLVGVSLFCEIAYALVVTVALPLYLGDTLGWRDRYIGPVLSAFLLAETLFKAPLAHLSDRVGRKPLIVFGILVSIASVLLMTRATGWATFMVLSAVNGVGGAALWPSVFASVADVTTDEERVHSMSVFNMMYMIGLGVAPILKSIVTKVAAHANDVFPFTAAVFGAALATAGFLIPWHRGSAHKDGSPHPDAEHRMIFPVLAFFMTMSFFQTLGLQIMNGPLVRYVKVDLGLKEEHIGWPFLVLAVAVAVLAVPIGGLGGRWGRVRSVMIGLGLASIGMFLLPMHHTVAWFLAVAIPMILGFLLSIPAWLAIITDLAPISWRGRVYGYVATAQGVGAIAGPTLGMWLRDLHGHGSPFLLSGCVLALTFIGGAVGLKEDMRAVTDK
jgi:MFS family permease